MVKYELKEFNITEVYDEDDTNWDDRDKCHDYNLKVIEHDLKKIEHALGVKISDEEREEGRKAYFRETISYSTLYGIYINDKLIGSMLTKIAEHMTIERGYYEEGILLQSLYLKKKYRNLGIGTDIIKNLIRHDDVYLNVCKYDDRLIKFYDRLGFKLENKGKHYNYLKHDHINN